MSNEVVPELPRNFQLPRRRDEVANQLLAVVTYLREELTELEAELKAKGGLAAVDEDGEVQGKGYEIDRLCGVLTELQYFTVVAEQE